ncbi:MAG: hypothetical protein ABIG37_03690 [Nanoarchaeota archaeon]|nr:hypothetical protein [Nanoarchaeota archaeon]
MKQKKEKALKPSLRENKRYLLLEKSNKKEVEKAILDYIGILGYAKASPQFIGNNILAINRKETDKIRASLNLAGILVKRVSGSLKKIKR